MYEETSPINAIAYWVKGMTFEASAGFLGFAGGTEFSRRGFDVLASKYHLPTAFRVRCQAGSRAAELAIMQSSDGAGLCPMSQVSARESRLAHSQPCGKIWRDGVRDGFSP